MTAARPGVSLNQRAWSGVKALIAVQCGLTLGMAALFFVLSGWIAVYSSGLAGGCCVFSTMVFALISFRKSGAKEAISIARSFYRAEAMKWLVTVVLMTVIFAFVPIAAGAFFATFCIVQMAYWVAPKLFR